MNIKDNTCPILLFYYNGKLIKRDTNKCTKFTLEKSIILDELDIFISEQKLKNNDDIKTLCILINHKYYTLVSLYYCYKQNDELKCISIKDYLEYNFIEYFEMNDALVISDINKKSNIYFGKKILFVVSGSSNLYNSILLDNLQNDIEIIFFLGSSKIIYDSKNLPFQLKKLYIPDDFDEKKIKIPFDCQIIKIEYFHIKTNFI